MVKSSNISLELSNAKSHQKTHRMSSSNDGGQRVENVQSHHHAAAQTSQKMQSHRAVVQTSQIKQSDRRNVVGETSQIKQSDHRNVEGERSTKERNDLLTKLTGTLVAKDGEENSRRSSLEMQVGLISPSENKENREKMENLFLKSKTMTNLSNMSLKSKTLNRPEKVGEKLKNLVQSLQTSKSQQTDTQNGHTQSENANEKLRRHLKETIDNISGKVQTSREERTKNIKDVVATKRDQLIKDMVKEDQRNQVEKVIKMASSEIKALTSPKSRSNDELVTKIREQLTPEKSSESAVLGLKGNLQSLVKDAIHSNINSVVSELNEKQSLTSDPQQQQENGGNEKAKTDNLQKALQEIKKKVKAEEKEKQISDIAKIIDLKKKSQLKSNLKNQITQPSNAELKHLTKLVSKVDLEKPSENDKELSAILELKRKLDENKNERKTDIEQKLTESKKTRMQGSSKETEENKGSIEMKRGKEKSGETETEKLISILEKDQNKRKHNSLRKDSKEIVKPTDNHMPLVKDQSRESEIGNMEEMKKTLKKSSESRIENVKKIKTILEQSRPNSGEKTKRSSRENDDWRMKTNELLHQLIGDQENEKKISERRKMENKTVSKTSLENRCSLALIGGSFQNKEDETTKVQFCTYISKRAKNIQHSILYC
jgi:hypothetical protein